MVEPHQRNRAKGANDTFFKSTVGRLNGAKEAEQFFCWSFSEKRHLDREGVRAQQTGTLPGSLRRPHSS